MDYYWALWGVLAVVVVALQFTSASESVVPSQGPQVASYRRHMWVYVVIYSLMMVSQRDRLDLDTDLPQRSLPWLSFVVGYTAAARP
jgi:hypothetical protein